MVQAGKNGSGQAQPPPGVQLRMRMFNAAQQFALRATFTIEQQVEELIDAGVKPEDIEIGVAPHQPTVIVRAKKPKSNIVIPGVNPNLGRLPRVGGGGLRRG